MAAFLCLVVLSFAREEMTRPPDSFLWSDSEIKRTTPIEKTTEQPAKCKKRDQNALAAGGPIA